MSTDMSEYPSFLKGYEVVHYDRGGRDLRDSAAGKPATPQEKRMASKPKEKDIYDQYRESARLPGERLAAAPPPPPPVQPKPVEPELEDPKLVLDRLTEEVRPDGQVVVTTLVGDFTFTPEALRVTADVMVLLFSSSRDIVFTPAKKAKLYATVFSNGGAELYGLYYSGIKFPAFSEEEKQVMVFHLTGVHHRSTNKLVQEAKETLISQLETLAEEDDFEFDMVETEL